MRKTKHSKLNVSDGIIMYASEDGQIRLDVKLQKETVWLTQKQMAMFFDKNVKTINEYIINVFKEGELKRNSVIWKSQITASDGHK